MDGYVVKLNNDISKVQTAESALGKAMAHLREMLDGMQRVQNEPDIWDEYIEQLQQRLQNRLQDVRSLVQERIFGDLGEIPGLDEQAKAQLQAVGQIDVKDINARALETLNAAFNQARQADDAIKRILNELESRALSVYGEEGFAQPGGSRAGDIQSAMERLEAFNRDLIMRTEVALEAQGDIDSYLAHTLVRD